MGVVVFFAPQGAAAHPDHGPSWGERYLKVEVATSRARLVYGITFSARYGREIRVLVDANRDGVVGGDEARAWGRSYLDLLGKNVTVEVDDRERRVRWAQPFVAGLEGRVGAGPVAVETSTELEHSSSTRSLVVEDRAEFEGVYRTAVMVAASGEAKILRSGRGRSPRRIEKQMVFLDLPSVGPPPARVISVQLELPTRALVSRYWKAIGLSCVGALLVALLAVAQLRRRRRSRATAPGRDNER